MSSRSSSADAVTAVAQLHDRLHGLAPLFVGDADAGDVGNGGMLEQHGVDLGGIDVHAAGDDQLGACVR